MISQSQAAQAIESYESQLQRIAETLDKILISRYGDDAAWELNADNVLIPAKFNGESDAEKIESAKFFS